MFLSFIQFVHSLLETELLLLLTMIRVDDSFENQFLEQQPPSSLIIPPLFLPSLSSRLQTCGDAETRNVIGYV